MKNPVLYTFDNSDIHSNTYKNKSACYCLENCIIDLKEFSKWGEWQQSDNIKVYCEDKRLKKYINRNPLTNTVWYNESFPTIDFTDDVLHKYSIEECDNHIDSLFFLYDYLEWQYSHFITDVYPKMWYYPLLREKDKDLKFGQIRPIINFSFNLINDTSFTKKLMLKSEFAHEITDFYLKTNERLNDFVPLQIGKVYFIDKLYIPVPYTSQDVLGWPERQYQMYNLLTEESKNVKNIYSEKIFISRNDTLKNGWFNNRHCMNEKEISNSLEKEGYQTIELMPLSIFEKIKVFHTAKKIVQQIGSNCFNAVFCQPGTKLYTLIHPNYSSWIELLTNISEHSHTDFIPITDGIELLSLEEYPGIYVNYKRTDIPWVYKNIDNLIKIVNKDI